MTSPSPRPSDSKPSPSATTDPPPPGRRTGSLRRTAAIALSALLLGLAGVLSIAAVSQADDGRQDESTTLLFDVAFSPQSLIATNNERDPNSPLALGDENVFHDQLFVDGEQVGDEAGSCVVVALSPTIVANCSMVVRLSDGDITAQFATSPGPAPKPIAVTGGTGAYRTIGGEGTLVEFGDETGTLTLRIFFFDTVRGRG